MLYIITALYAEAAPFIKHYNLKRDRLMKRHELYCSEQDDILLLITKPGKISAAMAVTELLVTHTPSANDFLVNVGVCGTTGYEASIAPIYICTNILDHDTGKYYYPDMLFNHPFKESGIETCSVVINDKALVTKPLVDMEVSAIYQVASSFFAPHRMSFIKIPSDNLEISQVTRETVTDVITNALPAICEWLDNFLKSNSIDGTISTTDNSKNELTKAEEILFEDLVAKLNLSVTMQEQLHQLFIYRKLTKGNLDALVLPDIPEGRITNQKRTILFDEFRKQFL